jgi:putative flippase GtrA
VARELLPQVEDNEWFFDTEFLVLAERNGFRIHEVPVDWVDDLDSRVDIIRTARDDLRGLVRLCLSRGRHPTHSQPSDLPESVASFARVGVASTLAYLILFFALAGSLGRFGANALALALCTVANTAVHRRYTFAGRGTPSSGNLILGGLTALTTSIAVTSLALGVFDASGNSSLPLLAAALIVANGVAALARFLLLRAWIFRTIKSSGGLAENVTDYAALVPDVELAHSPSSVILNERQTG